MTQRDRFERAHRESARMEPPPGRASVFGTLANTDPRVSIRGDGAVQVGALTLTKSGIVHEGTPTPEDMQAAGKLIRSIGDRYNILVGDWLTRAEIVWGDEYARVAGDIGYEVSSLRNFKSTMSRIPQSMRNDWLTFNHYYIAVSKLDGSELAAWLERAVTEQWSYRQLQDAIEHERPTPDRRINSAVKVFTQSRQKYQRIFKQFSRAGAAQRAQISQMIDEQIAELEQMKRELQGKR